jgi:SAM-dependent methyltransferase
VRNWLPLYRTSVALGGRYLLRHGYRRDALLRVVIPLDPSRYLELPWVLTAIPAQTGERVLDLASPKLLAVMLARRGAEVVSVDELEDEVERWRGLAASEPNLRFEVADGRVLPFEEGSFDHAICVSVLEHIREPGDEQALLELERVVRPGGRVVLTMPYAKRYREDWVDAPMYVDHGDDDGRYFFQRYYDDAALERLVAAAPRLREIEREVVGLRPNWQPLYARTFPWMIALGPLYGLLAYEHRGSDGDVVRLVLERE